MYPDRDRPTGRAGQPRCAMRTRTLWVGAAGVGAAGVLIGAFALAGCDSKPNSGTARPVEPAEQEAAGPPLFEDVTTASGIKHTYHNGEDPAVKPKHLSIL